MQTKRTWLADLPANKKPLPLLFKFFKAIGVGERENIREKELKWEQRDNQAGIDLFD